MKPPRGSVTPYRGRWRARVAVDGEEHYCGIHDTEAGGWRAIAAFLARHIPDPRGPLTLGDFGPRALDTRERAGIVSVSKERSRWRTHIEGTKLAALPLRDVRHAHVFQALVAIAGKRTTHAVSKGRGFRRTTVTKQGERTVSKGTVRQCRELLKSIFRQAMNEGLVKSNPVSDIRVADVLAKRREGATPDDDAPAWTFLAADEIETLVAAEIPEQYRGVFVIAIYTGLRVGEIQGLRWQDVVLDGPQPRIMVRRTRELAPKSKRSRRAVPLFARARAALLRLRDEGGVRRALGPVWPRDPVHEPGRLRHESYRWQWRTWGPPLLGRHVRFHDLRHTCASHLVMGTWGRAFSLQEVCDWMGHSSITVTMRYAHLAPGHLHDAVAEAERGEDGEERER
jgi:integrase